MKTRREGARNKKKVENEIDIQTEKFSKKEKDQGKKGKREKHIKVKGTLKNMKSKWL